MSIWLPNSYLVFIRCCHLHLPSLSSVVPEAFGALELKGPLCKTSYLICTCRPFFFQYFNASNFTSNFSMDSALNTRSSLYNSNYGQSALNFVIRAAYITIKEQWSHDKYQHQKTSHYDNCQLMSCFLFP